MTDFVSARRFGDHYEVYKFYNGRDALRCVEETEIDLAILDVMLPDIDGFRICQKIRERFFFPVIMLTAKIEDSDKIMGLTIGADDYITKPFNPLEVVARVKTQLRRCSRYNVSISSQPAEKTEYDIRGLVINKNSHKCFLFGRVARVKTQLRRCSRYNVSISSQPAEKTEYDIRGLVINKNSHKCFLFGREVSLTPIEFSILWYLCEHQGKVVPSEELFEAVWKEKYLNNNNTVMAHIGRLREKLEEPARKPRFIKTIWGVGYEIE